MKVIENQQKAISSRNNNILLSASAGTGKTYTMVERIVSLVKDGEDISSFLVLAFGNDASKEMQDRIEKGIFQLAREDKKFSPQLKKLKVASVSTIHSFALEIAKTYFAVSGASPKAKVLLGAEEDILKSTAMDKVFLDCYENADPNFLSLVEYFIQGRKDDRLKEYIFKLYTASRNMPKGEFERNFFETLKSKKLHQVYLETAKKKASSLLCNYLLKTECHEVYEKHYIQAKDILTAILDAKNLEELQMICGVALHAKTRKNKNHPESWEAINENFHKLVRNRIKDFVYDTRDDLETLCETASFHEEYCEIARKLFVLCELFENEYAIAKSKKDFVDFSDTEHMLLAVLRDEKSREELSVRYKHIFCDEYQDVSKIQEEILTLLSANGNLFVVGDIKQSIYGFRACDQTVIKNREIDILSSGNGVALPMNTNFRSHADILEFINSVFSVCMNNPQVCEYEKSSMFEACAEFPDLDGVEIAVAKKQKTAKKPRSDVYSVVEDKGEAREEINAQNEAIHIVKFIKRYLGKPFDFPNGTREVRLSDFAVLLRVVSDNFAKTLASVLESANLPCFIASSESTLESHKKVLFLFDFLKTIANPFDDVPLYSTLVSPFFEISADTLLKIRKSCDGKYFHQSFFGFAKLIAEKYQLETLPFACDNHKSQVENLKDTLDFSSGNQTETATTETENQTENCDIFAVDFSPILKNQTATNAEKAIAKFMTDFAKYRTLSCISVFDMLNIAISENNVLEKINLAFGDVELDFARQFISFLGSMKDTTLPFICEKIEKAFETIKLSAGQTSTNAICIMTMHKSKGLEFPFTIIANTGKQYNLKDASSDMIFHKDYGIAFPKKDISLRKRTDLFDKIALKNVIIQDSKEEELRILYVALTRAKFKLLITGTIDDDFYLEDNILLSDKVPKCVAPQDVYAYNNHLAVILASLEATKYQSKYQIVKIESESEEIETAKVEYNFSGVADDFADKLAHPRNIEFPIVPTKFTATQRLESFSKKVEEENLDALEKYETQKIIDFANAKSQTLKNGETTLSKATIGTAYHKILEEIDFYMDEGKIQTAVANMIENGDIPPLEYDIPKIYKLTNNPLFGGVSPHREVPFVMQMPSEMFDLPSGDMLLCQGVIDCVFQNENGSLTLVDYKATSIKNPQVLANKYYKQLETYKIACEKILKKKVEKCYIYSIFAEEMIGI